MVETGEGMRPLVLEEERLSLDFVNQVMRHTYDHETKQWSRYSDLAGWAREKGVITEDTERRLLAEAARREDDAELVLERAVVLGEALYRIFLRRAGDKAVDSAVLEILNAVARRALQRLQLVSISEGFIWSWTGEVDSLDWILFPIARSAAELLTSSEELQRVGQCADKSCNWLFFDKSRNRSRRWCDMKSCGNRAKAHRHYHRRGE